MLFATIKCMATKTQRVKFRDLAHVLLPQSILLSFVGALYILSLAGAIPSPKQLNEILVSLFKTYGLVLIAISSFLENLVAVNAYFPGAFTILTGMSLTAGHPGQAVLTYFAIYIPAYCANLISFLLGRSQQWRFRSLEKPPKASRLWVWFFLTYWHPQLAAASAFSAGSQPSMDKMNFLTSSLCVSLFWSIFWAIIIYHFGLSASVARHFATLFIVYIVLWAGFDTWKFLQGRTIR